MSYKCYRKRKRDRDTNWSNTEKQFLQNFAAEHRIVLDDRGNDTEMINKKNDAWHQIQRNMQVSGFYRNVNKLKQQWRRIKLDAKKRKLPLMVPNTAVFLPQKTIENQRLMVKTELAGFSHHHHHHSIFYASSENGSENERHRAADNKSFDMANIMPKRYRSANWTCEEKQLLFQYIQPLREIIDDKRNDTVMQARKRDAWLEIQRNMMASGYQRDVLKYKEQWVRMKFQKGHHRPSVISGNSTGSSISSSIQLSESGSVVTNETEIDIKQELDGCAINTFLPSQNVSCEIGNGGYGSSQESQADEIQQMNDQFSMNVNESRGDLKKKTQTNMVDGCSEKSTINHNHEQLEEKEEEEEEGVKKTHHPPQTTNHEASELHRYRIAVEKKRLKLLDIQMHHEEMLFQKEYQIKVLKLEMMKKYKETP